MKEVKENIGWLIFIVIASAIMVYVIKNKPKHRHKYLIDINCTNHIVKYTYGYHKESERMISYRESGGCVIITKPERCYSCGGVTHTIDKKICGTYIIEDHTFCW